MAHTAESRHRLKALVLVVLPFVAVVIAVVLAWNKFIFAKDLILLGILYTLTAFGVTVGYHRLLTHQSFNAPAWLRGILLILGVMAWEGPPIAWASTHIKHHAHSDEEGDPHSPLEGFWHAHVGWIFSIKNFPDPKIYAPHLLQDPVIVWVDRYTALWMSLALIIPFVLGGWTALVWAGGVRIFLTTHVSWSVNSVCHTFGKRAFETTDESRNEWVVGLLAFGDGWHNNHHAFPRSAFHGFRWYQIDFAGLLIRGLEALGLAWDVQRISEQTIEAHAIHTKGVQGHLGELRMQLSSAIDNAKKQFMAMVEYRGTPAVTGADMLAMTKSCEDSLERLNTIQVNMVRATHLKKQKLIAYMNEVQRLVDEAKAKTAHLVSATA